MVRSPIGVAEIPGGDDVAAEDARTARRTSFPLWGKTAEGPYGGK
jgi:hypothetical protein